MSQLIISVSGLRGIVGKTLDPQIAMQYARACAAELSTGSIVVARDGRSTGRPLMSAIAAGLSAMGRSVLCADVAATPTVGVLVRAHSAAGGIQISASHNPAEYNGMKLFGPDGRVVSANVGARVAERFRQQEVGPSEPGPREPLAWSPYTEWGTIENLTDTTSKHLALVLDTVVPARIRKRAFRVMLDSNHGAGAVLGRKLLDTLGCQTTFLGEQPDGRFEHPPEPTVENLAGVQREVVECQADVGFCQDPDADRLVVIDETGKCVGEEYTLAICLNHRLQHRAGPLVINCATSRMSQDLAEQYGVRCFRSAVGEANVADMMIAQHAVYGGEGNGGPIDPRVGYVRDSFVGIAQILDAMAERSMKLSELVKELPRYGIYKTKLDLAASQVPAAFASLQARFPEAQVNTLDGMRLDWPNQWLLIRGSNTEPIVRIIAEAPTVEAAQKLCEDAAHVMA